MSITYKVHNNITCKVLTFYNVNVEMREETDESSFGDKKTS